MTDPVTSTPIPAAETPMGVLVMDKPPGPSSSRAVTRVKHQLVRGAKVGHAGTLDPFATGVLLVLIGRATRWSDALMGTDKQYVATLRLGGTTASHDTEKPEIRTVGAAPVSRQQLLDAIAPLTGLVLQRPPAFSALRIAGRKSYKLARKGVLSTPEPRLVRVDSIELLDYQWPEAVIRIDCGKGTYIRSIARDLGDALGVGGYLTALRRTRSGPFTIAMSTPMDDLTPENLPRLLRAIDATLLRPNAMAAAEPLSSSAPHLPLTPPVAPPVADRL